MSIPLSWPCFDWFRSGSTSKTQAFYEILPGSEWKIFQKPLYKMKNLVYNPINLVNN